MKRAGSMISTRAIALIYAVVWLGAHVYAQAGQVETLPVTPAIPRMVPRLALVIGAEHYATLSEVPNALNDAKQVATRLVQFGFDFVRYVPDPKNDNEIYDYIQELAQRAGGQSEQPAIIVLFFAGHGFHQQSTNYIVPVSASPDDLNSSSVPVTTILDRLTVHTNGIAIFLFDSCRKVISSKDGFTVQSDPKGAAILGLAAKYGNTAASFVQQGDANSPYVTALTHYLDIQGYRLPELLGHVSDEVKRVTRSTQTPEVYYLGGANGFGFFFNPREEDLTTERVKWEETLQTNSPKCVDIYRTSHPGSPYLLEAVRWLKNPSHESSEPESEGICPDERPAQ